MPASMHILKFAVEVPEYICNMLIHLYLHMTDNRWILCDNVTEYFFFCYLAAARFEGRHLAINFPNSKWTTK